MRMLPIGKYPLNGWEFLTNGRKFYRVREIQHGRTLHHEIGNPPYGREHQRVILFHRGKRAIPLERALSLENVSPWKESFTMSESFNMGARIATMLNSFIQMCLCYVLLNIAHFQFGTILLYEHYDQNLIIVVNRLKELRTISRPFWEDYLT